MESNVVIVHGSNDSEEGSKNGEPENERHWKAWLKNKLEQRGFKVSNELYPRDWNPDYEEWKKIFEKNKINENSILIGHSAGCAFILRWLSEKRKKVKKVILIAPYVLDSGVDPCLKDFVNFDIENLLKDFSNELVIFLDNKDDSEIIRSAEFINKKFGGKLINLPGRGHFIEEDMGTKEFPELLDEVLKD